MPAAAAAAGLGKRFGLAGFGMMSAGGFLGGHLTFADAVNVNKTADHTGPSKWTAVLDEDGMSDGDRRTVEVGGVSLLLHRSEGTIHAVDAVCSHMGGPLEKGKIENGCVICPWHGSTFRLADGTIVRGPATRPQPSLRNADKRRPDRSPPGRLRPALAAAQSGAFDLSTSESPEFTGRVISALFHYPNLMARTGQVVIAAAVAKEFGVLDIDGTSPPALTLADTSKAPVRRRRSPG